VLEKFAALHMLGVHLPTTDGRYLILSRYTQAKKRSAAVAHTTQAGTAATTAIEDSVKHSPEGMAGGL